MPSFPQTLANRKCAPVAKRTVRCHVPLDAGCSQNPGERKGPQLRDGDCEKAEVKEGRMGGMRASEWHEEIDQ